MAISHAADIARSIDSITIVAGWWWRCGVPSTAFVLIIAMCLAVASCATQKLPQASQPETFGTADPDQVDTPNPDQMDTARAATPNDELIVVDVKPAAPDSSAVSFSAAGDWLDVTGDLIGLESSCGNIPFVSAHPDTDEVLATVSTHGLFSLAPESDGWTQLGSTGAQVDHRTQWIEFDPDDSDRYWVSGAYGSGIFQTDNGGSSFRRLGDLRHVDRVSVDLSDPERRTMLAGIHEESDLMLSLDGGSTWENLRDRLPEDVGFSSTPLILGSTYFLGSYRGKDAGIYRSDDGGETWERVFETGVLGAPVVTDDFIAWSLESNRGGLAVSVDGGDSFQTSGASPGSQSRTLVDLGAGGLATTAKTGLMVSTDLGESWRPVGPDLSFRPKGVAYSAGRSAFYAWTFTCNFGVGGNPVLPESVMQLTVESER